MPALFRKSWKKAAAGFARARSGAAAVEFALLALPFFLMSFGLAEVTVMGFAQTSLDFSVSEIARQIRTGQFQTSGVTGTQVKTQLCNTLTSLLPMDCDANLYVDTQKYTSFVAAQNPNPVSNGALNTAGFGYNPGQPSDIVVVRAFYRWHVITPALNTLLGTMNGGDRLLCSTLMFRNEPYPTGGGGG